MSVIEFITTAVFSVMGATTGCWLTEWLLNRRYAGEVVRNSVIYGELHFLHSRACLLVDAVPTHRALEGSVIINAVGKLMMENRLTDYQRAVIRDTLTTALAHM